MIVAEDDALDVPLARPVPAVRVNAVDPVVVVVVVGGGGVLRVLPVNLDGVPVGGHALPLQPHDCAVCVSGENKKNLPPISRVATQVDDGPTLPRGSRGGISTLATVCVTGSQMTTPAVSFSEVQQFPMVESESNEIS